MHNMNKDFSTSITVDQSPEEVFTAINNVAGWWHGEVKGNSENLNDEFTYQMKEFHFSKQRIIEMIPNKRVVWLVTESKLTFLKDPDEWTGTKLIFAISTENNKTLLHFTHEGLLQDMECYRSCSNGWTRLIRESLMSLITTGVGKEVF